MPTPRTEGSHERDSGIKKAEISEWARDDQGSAQLVLQRQRGPRRLLGLELVLHHGSADGLHLPSVSLGWCPPSLKAQVFLSTLELVRACTSPARHIHPSCLSGDGLGLTLQNIAPNKTLPLVQECLRHHSEAAKPTTDSSAKDPNNMCN